jgi:formate hydrogenlyase subunit 6/NADH:ubiquinone oxidoreductase subunit I
LTAWRLKSVCARCGTCRKACPTDIIRPSFDPADLAGLMTPVLHFDSSYCLPDCTTCGQVCPTGALAVFSVEDKKRMFIGTVRLDLEKCLLTFNRECDRCKFYCAFDAIEITKPENSLTSVPRMDRRRCVGCGACKIVCPGEAIAMIAIGSENNAEKNVEEQIPVR